MSQSVATRESIKSSGFQDGYTAMTAVNIA